MQAGMSIIVPFLNEYEGINSYCSEIDNYAKQVNFPLELVFVDDGSNDNTSQQILKFAFANINRIKLLTLSKNFGSHAAIRAGVLNSYYDICTWMGSDLQEPVEFLDLGYSRINEDGYDAVYIEKESIKVSWLNRSCSKLYASLMRKFAVKNYVSNSIGTIIFNKKIKNYLNDNIESNSSIMLQIMDSGFKNTTISLAYKERSVGKSKWTLSKKMKLLIDSFVSFSFMPIRLVSVMGIMLFLLGIIFGGSIIIYKLSNPAASIPGYSTLASLISIGFGLTNISLGIIAEYLWRSYDASRKRPSFIISDIDEFVNE